MKSPSAPRDAARDAHVVSWTRLAAHLSARTRSMVRCSDLASEIAQRALIRLWRRANRSVAPAAPLPSNGYLQLVTRSEASHLARHERARLEAEAGWVDERSSAPETECAFAGRERLQLPDALRICLLALPQRQRAVFLLHALEGLSSSVIASKLGLRPTTVRTHLARARLRLRSEAQLSGLVSAGN